MSERIAVFEKATTVGRCCSCTAVFFAFFTLFAPFYMWNSSWDNTGLTISVGTGPYVASSISAAFDCGLFCTGVIAKGWTYYEDITSELACSNNTNIYEDWSGKYGFCDGLDGTYTQPSETRVIRALTVTTIVFLVLAATSCCTTIQTGKRAFIAGVFTFLSTIFAISAFSTFVASPWYKDLHAGTGSLPTMNTEGSLTAVTDVKLYYGPSLLSLIVVSVCSLVATFNFCTAAKVGGEVPEDIILDDSPLEFNDSEADMKSAKVVQV
mmetsp:Transcript_15849/g.17893  ORF Transcript_15849/g.17893 Transcript_15849/m.17893 type:complete len:267 (+) Transcript_15849:145-945(+)|eukprot:CAMPEP_0184034204 /NCGR_PEP_ID=MMETSP0955-20130417/4325_1 /TAXON_ID=627963 /ORGANISM="Aplanochytrium sp, Strain PBS07" /LENGTH=266 /DNA_ID=CAMNT_0026320823 /DNA_START=235 /DNA_END=1035 /DNA_ORIENTATION=+